MAKRKNTQRAVVAEWADYFKRGELEDWRRLMRDLDFDEDFASKTQCRQALKSVWVNIEDFLDAIKAGEPVHRFRNAGDLAAYTVNTGRIFPKRHIPKGSPLRALMARIF